MVTINETQATTSSETRDKPIAPPEDLAIGAGAADRAERSFEQRPHDVGPRRCGRGNREFAPVARDVTCDGDEDVLVAVELDLPSEQRQPLEQRVTFTSFLDPLGQQGAPRRFYNRHRNRPPIESRIASLSGSRRHRIGGGHPVPTVAGSLRLMPSLNRG
jgi:hypothetical protein